MRRLAWAAAAAVAAGVLAPTAAHADWPLERKATDLGVHTVIIEAPNKAWGLRKIANDYDRRLPNVDIWARRGIQCMPTVTCIRVTVADFGWTPAVVCEAPGQAWIGCAQIGGDDPWLLLNTTYDKNKNIACHELGHALGLEHHDQPGCVGPADSRITSPSDYEINLLEGLL